MNFKFSHGHIQGLSHIARGEVCQDYSEVVTVNGITTMLISDGLGSCSHSEFGSEAMGDIVPTLMGSSFEELFSNDDGAVVRCSIMKILETHLRRIATKHDVERNQVYCTLSFVSFNEKGDFLLFHVGDGAILSQLNGEDRVLGQPQNGNTSRETVPAAIQFMEDVHLAKGNIVDRKIPGFFLCSDGMTDVVVSGALKDPKVVKSDKFHTIMESVDNGSLTRKNGSEFLKAFIQRPSYTDDISFAAIVFDKSDS